MLLKRILVSFGLLPVGLILIAVGGWVYVAGVALILSLAGVEYARLFRAAKLQPSEHLIVGGILLIVVGREIDGFASADWMISVIILAGMTYHLWQYESGRELAASDFSVSLGGVFYIGWLGAYLVSLRNLPNGIWWILIVLPAVWLADAAAYFVGTRWGRHKLAPRLSPKKSWEGYIGGVAIAIPGGALLAFACRYFAGVDSGITPLSGAIVGLAMATLPTLGDLGESMIKRQVGVKDSGTLLPGHGGVFDRIDSWLWGAVIGYYIIVWFFQ